MQYLNYDDFRHFSSNNGKFRALVLWSSHCLLIISNVHICARHNNHSIFIYSCINVMGKAYF